MKSIALNDKEGLIMLGKFIQLREVRIVFYANDCIYYEKINK